MAVLLLDRRFGLARLVAACQALELAHVDADRERPRDHAAPQRLENPIAQRLGARLLLNEARKVVGVRARLQPHQVVREQ